MAPSGEAAAGALGRPADRVHATRWPGRRSGRAARRSPSCVGHNGPPASRPGRSALTEKLYAIIHEADGDTIWKWQSGRKARFVEYGGYHRARELADASGATLALWGSQYGQRGVPGDATPDALLACVRDAIDRRQRHP